MPELAALVRRRQLDSGCPLSICLMGPTASGKTSLAVSLVELAPCEIISVDSALVYLGMDIGTAKPDAATLLRAPHRLIDLRDPVDAYSAADFRSDALLAMKDIIQAGKIPLLVGGSMLYFRALLYGLAELPAADPLVRADLEQQAARLGWPAMHRLLAAVDPITAARLKPGDSQRIQRALEVYRVSGKALSLLHREQADATPTGGQSSLADDFPGLPLLLGISPRQRAVLHQRIAQRFDQMLVDGFEQEVRTLRQRADLHASLPAIRSVGYRQMWEYLEGKLSYAEMRERGVIATRQLAKRQLTWLRGWSGLLMLETDETGLVVTLPAQYAGQNIAAITLKLLREGLT